MASWTRRLKTLPVIAAASLFAPVATAGPELHGIPAEARAELSAIIQKHLQDDRIVGAEFLVIASRPPRQVVVAYTQPNSAAATPPASLARGAKVLAVDGVDVVNAADSASVAALNAGLFPSAPGGPHRCLGLQTARARRRAGCAGSPARRASCT